MNNQAKTVCWNAIVKNEANVIKRCMESMVDNIDYWVVVDTGSTDGTQNIIRSFMKEHNIPGELFERPWKNFGHNRSEAVELAENKADYLLFCDADMALNVLDPNWKTHLEAPAYMVNQRTTTGLVYGNKRLINAHLEGDLRFRYWGATHEYCDSIEPNSHANPLLESIEMRDFGDGGSKSDKYERDIDLLTQQLRDLKALTPNKPDEFEEAWRCGLLRHSPMLQKRSTFYLAQSWRDSDEPELALATYEKRAKQGGWDEEIWYSLLQAALLKEKLKYPDDEVIRAYTKAYEFRPKRAESLFHLARFHRVREQYSLGYIYALAATSIERPGDVLFLSADIYTWRAKDELAICAYWEGRYKMSFSLCEGLLANPALPDDVRSRIEDNRNFARERM